MDVGFRCEGVGFVCRVEGLGLELQGYYPIVFNKKCVLGRVGPRTPQTHNKDC